MNSMVEAQQKKDYYTTFLQLPIGQVIGLPLFCLTPTQTDDNNPPLAKGPIEACYNQGQILIIHGHHRYYEVCRRNQGNKKIQVRKIINPYLDFRA